MMIIRDWQGSGAGSACAATPIGAAERGERSSPREQRTGANWSSSFEAVVRSFLGDDDVVHVALAVGGVADADEARLLAQLGERSAAEVAHAGAEPADELVDVRRERPLVRHPALDALGHELHVLLVLLEVAIAAPGAHGAERAHPAVHLVGPALVEDGLAGALLGAGEEAPDHDGLRAARERLDDVSREADA